MLIQSSSSSFFLSPSSFHLSSLHLFYYCSYQRYFSSFVSLMLFRVFLHLLLFLVHYHRVVQPVTSPPFITADSSSLRTSPTLSNSTWLPFSPIPDKPSHITEMYPYHRTSISRSMSFFLHYLYSLPNDLTPSKPSALPGL